MSFSFMLRRYGAPGFGVLFLVAFGVLGTRHIRLQTERRQALERLERMEARPRAAPPTGAPAPVPADRIPDPAPTPPIAVRAAEPNPVQPPAASDSFKWIRLALTLDPAARLQALKNEGIRAGFQETLSVVSNASLDGFHQIFPHLLASWTPEEAQQAMAWVFRLPDSHGKILLLPALAASPHIESSRLLHYISEIPDPGLRMRATQMSLHHLAARDPAAAAQWIDRMKPEGTVSLSVITVLAQHWMRKDPAAASAWVSRLPAGPGRDQAFSQVAMVLAPESPDIALQWNQAIESAAIRQTSYHQILSAWSVRDPEAAVARAMMMPAGPEFDRLATQMAATLSRSNALEAAILAESIAHPGMRMGAITMVAHQWARRDPEAARRWAETLEDAVLKERVFRILEQQTRPR